MSVFTDALRRGEAFDENPGAFALWDSHPLSPGHALVIPRLEVVRLDDLDTPDLEWLWTLILEVKSRLRGGPQHPPGDIRPLRGERPTGIRLMVNEGLVEQGGPQHIAHLHVHLIPWYAGMKP